MNWSNSTVWLVIAGVLVAAELTSGTFYLLMLALGALAAAAASALGAGLAAQLVAAALVGGGATAAWHYHRARSPRSAPFQSNRDVNLDVGGTVHVAAWQPDRTARVQYRGAGWTAVYAGDGSPSPGEFTIVAVEGNRLLLNQSGRS
jgi:membrane protein implicated in regulation of membrane protease activity